MNPLIVNELILSYNKQVASFLGREALTIIPIGSWNAVKTHGSCHITRRGVIEIRISKYLVKEEDIKNTILHELCHAYAPWRCGHDWQWKQLAEKVGNKFHTRITRTSNREHSSELDSRVVCEITCPVCGKVTKYYRKSGIYYHPETYYCNDCGNKTLGHLQIKRLK